MKVNLEYVLISFFILWICPAISLEDKEELQYGLNFLSYETEKEKRTSLNLTPETPFLFPNGFILEFDISFKRTSHNFGYILRIVGEKEKTIDLLLSRTKNSLMLEPQITAVSSLNQTLYSQSFGELRTDFGKWTKVKLLINPSKGIFQLALNDKEFETTENHFQDFKRVRIVFGKNDIVSAETSDVPAMTIKDVFIKDIHGRLEYSWPLAQHADNGVYDEVKRSFAFCNSSGWLLDKHCYWERDTVFVTEMHPQIAYNKQADQLAIADRHSFSVYNFNTKSLTKSFNINDNPFKNKSNNLGYNTFLQKYFRYNFPDQVAYYHPETMVWDNETESTIYPYYWYHNRYFSPTDTALYTFGGYGYYVYKNDIVRYDFNSATWQRVNHKGDTIAPRYLAGFGIWDEKNILIFGGFGSENGEQEIHPKNYYDLYSFNIETSQIKKIWELENTSQNFVIANSLVVDTLNNCFYALCFPHQKFHTSLQLYRFSLEKPGYELLADSIPYQFSDISSYADLILRKDANQLVAITSHADSLKAIVSVYSLAFPSLNRSDVMQGEPNTGNRWYYAIVFVLIILILLPTLLWRYRNKTKKNTLSTEKTSLLSKETNEDNVNEKKTFFEKQSILLFGGFQVIDKDSNEITSEFTPLLKQLFLLILLNTVSGKGISTSKLNEILWFDKSYRSAKNNRGVSMSKLRVIFEKIGQMTVNYANSYWRIEMKENIYCDYFEALTLINRLSTKVESDDISKLVTIVSVGELLPNVETEWIDPFKSEFSNRLIDILLSFIAQPSLYNLSPPMALRIADAVFVHDSLNEDALKIKCTLLVNMGKNGLAQKTYASFVKEYQILFGINFKYSFEQIISQ